jgi:hypothetical protein
LPEVETGKILARREAMTDQNTYTLSKAQLTSRAKEFMRNNFRDAEPDWYYTRLGLLVDYIDHLTDRSEPDAQAAEAP